MNETVNLHLPQFEASDRIMRTDFNDAFAAIDEAVPRIVTGSYVGDGAYGRDNICSLTFDFEPKLIIICGEIETSMLVLMRGCTLPLYHHQEYHNRMCTVTWSGGTVSWWSTYSAATQMNGGGWKYHYVAFR